MYKRINIKILLIVEILLFSSCDKWLDLKPENSVIRQDFWKTEQQVHSAVIGCYASLLDEGLGQRFFSWGELRGDLVSDNVSCKWSNRNIIYGIIMEDNPVVKWEKFYKSINLCNTIIEFAKDALETDDTFTEEELKAYEAEALALRSLLYFYLVRSFGEVPLMLKAITTDQENFFVPKSPDSVVINQIIADLEIADSFAVTTYHDINHDKGRITKYAVNALQADVYLWKEDYEKCIEACNKIINSSRYGLVSGANWFQNIFVIGNSNESIFELQYSADKPNPYFDYFHPTGGEKQFIGSPLITMLYEDEDVRGDSATYWYGIDAVIYKYMGLSNIENLYRSENDSYAHWIFYRYSDVLLMKAEALNQLGRGAEALELVNRIQRRANATETVIDVEGNIDALADLILLERKKEFAFEGKRWYDLLRNAKRNNYTRADGSSGKEIIFKMIKESSPGFMIDILISKFNDPRSHYFPIYYEEVEINYELEQNSYYVK